MLVNLTPSAHFRSEMSRHKKGLRQNGYSKKEVKNLSFDCIFEPTDYVGVYFTSGSDDTIHSWCKQSAVNFKLYRKVKALKEAGASEEEIRNFGLNAWDYGVADSIEQVIDYYNHRDPRIYKGNHVIFVQTIKKNPNAPCCGWRWHKWGKYIGTKTPQCEYLNDEPEIDRVVIYSIYKVV